VARVGGEVALLWWFNDVCGQRLACGGATWVRWRPCVFFGV